MADVALSGKGFPQPCIQTRPSTGAAAQFLIVPGRSDPRLLIPLGSAPEMAGALDLYNAQQPLARVSQTVLRAGLRAGIAQAFLRDRCALRTEALVVERLKPVFGGADLSVSVSLGSPGVNQKPVLQVMNRRGKALGYAKVGWSRQSIDLIRNEEAALRGLERRAFTHARVPHVLDAGPWRHLYILVQAALGGRFRAPRHTIDERHVRFLVELHRAAAVMRRVPLPDPARIQDVKVRGFPYYAHLLTRAREFLAAPGRPSRVPCGPLHGDFCPWNVRTSAERLIVFDWEYARPDAPAGWDLFNFVVSTAVSIGHHQAGQIYRNMAARDSTNALLRWYFESLHVADEFVVPLFVSYLADALTRNCVLHGMRAAAQDVALRAAWAGLLNLAFHHGAPGISGRARA